MKNSAQQGSGIEALCLSLIAFYEKNKTTDGQKMAQLVQLLIAHESKPGGPYFGPDGALSFPTNLAVGYLFTLLGIPLPNVDAFIAKYRTSRQPTHLQKLLKKYDSLRQPTLKKPAPSEHKALFRLAQRELSHLQQPEKPLALAFLKKIQEADTATNEIALLPTFFARSLTASRPSFPLLQLGLANIYCWIAYSIYDHILDDEPAAAQLLPVANSAMRKSLQNYQQLFSATHPFQYTLQKTFDAMDHANAWEIAHARFQIKGKEVIISTLPSYGNYAILADRCSGHILGPLAIATLCDVSPKAFKQLEKGLRHYLIARQLSDDIHDWKEDFAAGHTSSTVAYMLKQLHITPGTHSFASLSTALQTNFWHHSMEGFTAIIVRHLRYSRRYLLQSGLLEKDAPLFALHARLETIAARSLAEYRSSKAFLSTYQPTANGSLQSRQSPRP